ncbi:MAG: glucose 1-dehydrogenase [Proteobacteria bacterium]|nr:MAG: glucose 1-dehydrogenase [Pseudomonadota bacterium]
MLDKKISLVTGAGSGIGREIAYKFAEEGSTVVVVDLNEDGGRETVAHIEKTKGKAIFIKSNAGKAKEAESLVDEIVKKFGALHIAVNNAGIGGPNLPIGEYPIEEWDKVISINLSGVFYGMRYQIPAILAAGGGTILNMASILGQVGFRNSGAYVAAKHGVVGLTKSAALEYSDKNIRINAVGPGFIKTPLVESSMTEEAKAGLVSKHPIGRLGESSEVAELVLWLASAKASFVTGAYYPVDGGYLAQ